MPDLAAEAHRPMKNRGWGLPPNIARASVAREKPPAKPAPIAPAPVEVVTIKSLPPGTLFRIALDYEALQDAFAERIEDLGVALVEIDEAAGMTRGNCQKLLSKSDAKWSRTFGWVSLGKMLKGTGLALAVIVDDERFAPIREQMQQRRAKRP